MKKRQLSWENCISFGCDNAAVMTGANKGVVAFIRKQNPEIFLSGCVIHLVHIAAKKSALILGPIDDILVDIFYYMKKSDKRQSAFKELQDIYNDVQGKKMLKHVCTRWLSIARCLPRMLENWDALVGFFKQEKHELDKKKN